MENGEFYLLSNANRFTYDVAVGRVQTWIKFPKPHLYFTWLSGVKFAQSLMRYDVMTRTPVKTIAGDRYQNIKFTAIITMQVKLDLYGF